MISVIIPTYRRLDSLRRTLDSLRLQTLPEYEALVIDNSPSRAVENLVTRTPIGDRRTVRYLPEANLGVHNARHTGAIAAKGDLLVFADDDATFHPGWLDAYSRAFDNHPAMAAAGGPVLPGWETAPPEWLRKFVQVKKMCPALGLMDLHPGFDLSRRGVFFSVNMAIRRPVLFEAGGFHPEAFGEQWLGDGEAGLNRELWKRDLMIGYVPEAIAYHQIPAGRMTAAYLEHRMANEGACDVYARCHERMPNRVMLRMAETCVSIIAGSLWIASRFVKDRTDLSSLKLRLFASRAAGQLKYVRRLIADPEFRQFVLKRDWLKDSHIPPADPGPPRPHDDAVTSI